MSERDRKCVRERPKLIFKGKSSNTQPSKTPINNRDIKAEVQKKTCLLYFLSIPAAAGLTAVMLSYYSINHIIKCEGITSYVYTCTCILPQDAYLHPVLRRKPLLLTKSFQNDIEFSVYKN